MEKYMNGEQSERADEVICSEKAGGGALGHYFAYVGVIVHELAHYAACVIAGVKVVHFELLAPPKRDYLGMVVHKRASPIASWFISLLPFALGTALGFALFADAVRAFNSSNVLYAVIAAWLGASITWRAPPSSVDVGNAWQAASRALKEHNIVTKLLLIAFLPFIYLTLVVLDVAARYFKYGPGAILWIGLVFIAAKEYVALGF